MADASKSRGYLKILKYKTTWLLVCGMIALFVFWLTFLGKPLRRVDNCDDPLWLASDADRDKCFNSQYPSRQEILDYLSDTTFIARFKRRFAGNLKDVDYISYFGSDGRRVNVSVVKKGPQDEYMVSDAGKVTFGSWRIFDVIQPLSRLNRTRNVDAIAYCDSEGFGEEGIWMGGDGCFVVGATRVLFAVMSPEDNIERRKGDVFGLANMKKGSFKITNPIAGIEDFVKMAKSQLPVK